MTAGQIYHVIDMIVSFLKIQWIPGLSFFFMIQLFLYVCAVWLAVTFFVGQLGD